MVNSDKTQAEHQLPTEEYGKGRLRRVNLEIQSSPVHRFGIFAEELILPGEVIEECPVLLINKNNSLGELDNYIFQWTENQAAVTLGYGGLYNHAANYNASYQKDFNKKIIQFVATRPIYRGEEIFIHYGENWFKSRQNIMHKVIDRKNRGTTFRVVFLSLCLGLAYAFKPITMPPLSPAPIHVHAAEAATIAPHALY